MLPFRVRTLRACGQTVVTTRGDLDLLTSPEFEAKVRDEIAVGCRTLVINLAHTSYIDSSALAALLRLHGVLRQSGGRMSIVGCQRHVARVLDVVGFRSFFRIEPIRTGRERHAAFAS